MAHATPPIVNALSVDVEDYYHASIFQEATKALGPRRFESRVVAAVDRVLSLLARHHVVATFFVLGEVAAAQPALVRLIASLGHEIACHGYDHSLVSSLSPCQFRASVGKAKHLLEDLTSKAVVGYRAPTFSMSSARSWAYSTLAELGFTYDSSVYPINHDRYGEPSAPRTVHIVYPGPPHPLLEVPIGTLRLLGVNWPIGGGGYFRLLPARLVQWGIHRVNAVESQPVVFYLHPWELDPGQPCVPMSLHHRFRHRVGLRRTEGKLTTLLGATRFSTISGVFASTLAITSLAPTRAV
jgi:polysaccharide deacetylase family protein (PEP-CTERM system associated)